MRRLVYLANAIAELFICLLPGSASRECLYIRANTPRESYARGSPSFFFLFKAYLVMLLSDETHDRFFPFLLTLRSSLDLYVCLRHLDLPVSFSFSLFPSFFLLRARALSLSLSLFYWNHYTISREKKENRKSTKKNGREVNKVGIRTISRNLSQSGSGT